MKWLLARTAKATLGKVLLAAYRMRTVGKDRIPPGGVILAGNHVSYLDPVLMWCGTPRPVHFMAKSELWSVPGLGWLLTRLWAFPVRRGEPDRSAIVAATDRLTRGDLVGIFPEGTRQREATDDLGEANEGVAFLAMRAGVPVVPVGIAGTDKALPPGARIPRFPRVAIVYGPPIDPSSFSEGGRKERVQAMTGVIMESIVDARSRAREM